MSSYAEYNKCQWERLAIAAMNGLAEINKMFVKCWKNPLPPGLYG